MPAPGKLYRAGGACASLVQRFRADQAGLEYLDCSEASLPPGGAAAAMRMEGRETLLFQWKGESVAAVGERRFALAAYDVLYVPLDAAFSLECASTQEARLILCSAPAENRHPAHHSRFQEIASQEDRIRRLKGKNVYLMFDVAECADRLMAGYTFFEPHARSWPPHNHTDQEEAYIFVRGRGAMEVYESPETLSFVHSVGEGDIVTIPRLNYHPVFSQDEPLEFIWCIAGARYWVGDKNKDFLSGKVDSVTT